MVLCVSSEHAISPQGLSLESAPASGVPWPWPAPPTVSVELCHCSKQIRVRILVPHSPACTSGSASPPGRPRRTRPCLRTVPCPGRGHVECGARCGAPVQARRPPEPPVSPTYSAFPQRGRRESSPDVSEQVAAASAAAPWARVVRGEPEGGAASGPSRCDLSRLSPVMSRGCCVRALAGFSAVHCPRAVSFRAERAPTPRAADAFQGWAADPARRHQPPGRGRPALPRASVSFPQGRGSRSVSYSPSKRCCSNCRAPHAAGPTRGSCPGRPSRRRGSRAVPAARPRPHSE